jgi:4-hydroxybenzoate polyprenyltransferase
MPLPVKPSDSSKNNDRGRVFAWLQLMRLPNVFTAVADVAMGYLVTHRNLEPPAHFAMLVVASCLLYLSGMVLNDVYDAEVDARERPERPIPSGRILLRSAIAVGWMMLVGGVLMGWIISYLASTLWPGAVASLLAASVVLYDLVLKRTPFAPLIMGACRTLNVLLGMSLVYREPKLLTAPWTEDEWLIAFGIGLYIVGVTVFARSEARRTSRGRLIGGLAVLLVGIALLAAVPWLTDTQHRLVVRPLGWYLLWTVLALITARRCLTSIFEPSPERVQTAIRHCVHTIIVLDAAVCVGYAGPFWGFAVLALIFPTMILTAWLRST